MSTEEAERLKALRRYEILDTPPEEAFDRVTKLAASLFAAPIAFISFIDAERQWLKSQVGLAAGELPRELAFCAQAVTSGGVCVLRDLESVQCCPTGDLRGLRFYAGAPLVTRDGHRIGSLGIADRRGHEDFDNDSADRLATLARLIMNELDLRLELAARRCAERNLQLLNDLMLAIAEAPNVSTAIETSLRLTCQAIGATYGRAWSATKSGTQCRLVAAWGPNGSDWSRRLEQQRAIPLTLTNSMVGRVLTTKERVVDLDMASAGQRYRASPDALALGMRSAICVPVQQEGRIFALNFMFEQPPPDLERLADRVEELAAKIRPVLARKLTEERITLLQSVVLHASDAVLVADVEGSFSDTTATRVIYASPAMARMTGYTAEDLLGRPADLLWPAPGNEAAIAQLYRTIDLGQPARLELACARKDGVNFWADISAVPMIDRDSGDRKLIAILRDTTERRRLEEALRQSEATFRQMFAANPIPMWAYDTDTLRFLEVNNSAIEQYGFSREQFLSMSIVDLIASDDNAARPRPFGRLGIRRHRKADGSEIAVEVITHPLEYKGHHAVIVAAIDVTEQKLAEEQIRQAKEAAEAASRAKTELLANMSHELRTPLNAIIGFSEIMQAGLFGPLGSDKYDGYVADIRHSAGHLLTVITDILDLAKIEANSFRLHEGVVAPAEIIASVLRLVKPRADGAGVRLRYDKRHGEVGIRVDETALKRVLINLLSNAVKFSEAGSTVEVSSAFDQEGAFVIAVRDHGIGMAPEEIPVALTPFRQVNTGLQRKYEGTGLGLPIAKQLVEMHGGTLSIDSARGAGTTVTIALPTARVTAAA